MELGDSGSVPTEFESWYRCEHPRLVVALGALTWDRDAARDAADEGFARALAQWERVGAMGSPTGWTYRVALNHLRRTMRRRKLEKRLHHRSGQTEPLLEGSPDDIWGLLNALAPRQRTAVALRYLADLSEADIAQANGARSPPLCPPPAAAWRNSLTVFLNRRLPPMPDSPVDELLDRLGRRPRPEPTPLADIAERARRIRRRRRTHAKAAAASVAVIGSLIVALLLVTVGQPSPTKVTVGATTTVSPPGTARPPVVAVDHLAPLADTALTPAGWSPLSLGAIQISVPSSWTIDSPQEEICPTGTDGPLAERRDDGVVFVSQTPYLGACPLPATVIKLASQSPTALLHAHSAVINSLPVSEGTTTSAGVSTQVVRTGGMQLDLLGPLAARVLATLTHSPLSVVLNSTVSTVPAGWRQLDFEGLRFDVPSQWRVDRLSVGQCPGNIAANAVTLDTEQVPQTSSCGGGPPLPTAGVLAASPGTVVTGPQGAAPSNATCLRRNGLRICVDPAPPSGGGFVAGFALNLLTAQVTMPGRTGADQIEIGLTGSGVTPLEILDSMRPAP